MGKHHFIQVLSAEISDLKLRIITLYKNMVFMRNPVFLCTCTIDQPSKHWEKLLSWRKVVLLDYNVVLLLYLCQVIILIIHILLFLHSAFPFSDPIQPLILQNEESYWLIFVYIQARSSATYFPIDDQI